MTINTKYYYIYIKVDWTNLIMQHLINLAMLQDLKLLLGLCMFVFTTANCMDFSRIVFETIWHMGYNTIIIAIVGLFLTAFVGAVFIWFWNTPIVKSSGQEQMILLIILCFLITIVFLIKPLPAVCSLQRIGSWFCFSLILCAVLVKLVQISQNIKN